MKKPIAAATFAAFAFVTSAAFAHAYPQAESPAKGATVKAAPSALWIEFDDALEPAFTTLTVTDAQGQSVVQGVARVSKTDSHRLSVHLKPLPSGTYSVSWHATDTDTHKTHGTYSFTVAP